MIVFIVVSAILMLVLLFFAKRAYERKYINFDHPDSIEFNLLFDHISALKQGNSIQKTVYSYTRFNNPSETRFEKG